MALIIDNQGNHNNITIAADVMEKSHGHVIIKGNNNTLTIGEGTVLPNAYIEFTCDHSSIVVGKNAAISGELRCCYYDTHIHIGDLSAFLGVRIFAHESGRITIGKDCMFSGGVMMDVSDMHSILDIRTNKRINFAKDIVIDDHVWVGMDVFIAKGVHIGKNAIVGAKSVVTRDVPENTLVAGVPARVLNEYVTWNKALLPK